VKRSTYILALLAAVLLAVILLWERRRPSTSEAEAARDRILVGLRADEVRAMERGGFQPLVLRRSHGGAPSESATEPEDAAWRLLGPVADAADTYAVNGFLERIISSRALRPVDAGARLEDLGLKPPRATWTLRTTERDRSLEVGRTAPMGEGLYVRADGKAFLVDAGMEDLFMRPAAAFRLRDLLPIGSHEVDALTVRHRDGRSLGFRKGGDGGWSVTEPYADWGASEPILTLLDDVCLCPVADFPEADKDATAGLDPPEVRLEVKVGARTFTVDLGGPAPGGEAVERRVFARCSGRPGLLAVSLNSLKSLDQAPETFRSAEVLRHTLFEAEEVLVTGAATVRIARDGAEGWRFLEPASPRPGADAPALAAALTALIGTRMTRPDRESPETGRPVTIVLRGTHFEERLQIREEAGSAFARPAGRPVRVELDREGWARVKAALRLLSGGDEGTSP
jgi:hypothetical protein